MGRYMLAIPCMNAVHLSTTLRLLLHKNERLGNHASPLQQHPRACYLVRVGIDKEVLFCGYVYTGTTIAVCVFIVYSNITHLLKTILKYESWDDQSLDTKSSICHERTLCFQCVKLCPLQIAMSSMLFFCEHYTFLESVFCRCG